VGVVAALVLGAVLFIAGCTKLWHASVWKASASGLGVPGALAALVPPVEIVFGVLLIAQLWSDVVSWLAAAVLTAFTALLIVTLLRGQRPPCACFGSATKRISWWDVARNLALIALALIAA